jgi:hypothetical protein
MAFELLHHKYLLKKLLTSTVKKLVMTLITQAGFQSPNSLWIRTPKYMKKKKSITSWLLVTSLFPSWQIAGTPKAERKMKMQT